MARPSSRRPGHNRKAQYSLFASYVVAVTGAAAGLLLIAVAIFDPTGFAAIRMVTAEISRPASLGLRNMVSGASSLDDVLTAYWRAGSQNIALRHQVDADRNRIIEAKAIAQENLRLKRLLKLVDEDQSDLLTARLISSSSSSARRFARLNAGRWQGVRPGMPVRASEGLVGRIHSVTPNTADVFAADRQQQHRAGSPRYGQRGSHLNRAGRWNRRNPFAGGRPKSVQPGRHPRHIGCRRHISTQYSGCGCRAHSGRDRLRCAARQSGEGRCGGSRTLF